MMDVIMRRCMLVRCSQLISKSSSERAFLVIVKKILYVFFLNKHYSCRLVECKE